MRWARGQIPSVPLGHFISKEEFDCAAVDHDVLMVEPVLVPVLAVDLDTLHKVPALPQGTGVRNVVGEDSQRLVNVDRHIDVAEPGRSEQVDWLRDDGIET